VAEIVEEISSSEYAIDINVSRFTWMPGFFLARVYGQALIQRLVAQQRLRYVWCWLPRDDLFLLLALRLFPLLSFNLITQN
jgi:uncharacterized membrane protein YdjX (TVP38/TMEM64 family)